MKLEMRDMFGGWWIGTAGDAELHARRGTHGWSFDRHHDIPATFDSMREAERAVVCTANRMQETNREVPLKVIRRIDAGHQLKVEHINEAWGVE
jgi:hypothetical protein